MAVATLPPARLFGEQTWAWHRRRSPPGPRRAQTQGNAMWTAGQPANQPWPPCQISSKTALKWSAKPFQKTKTLKEPQCQQLSCHQFSKGERNARTLSAQYRQKTHKVELEECLYTKEEYLSALCSVKKGFIMGKEMKSFTVLVREATQCQTKAQTHSQWTKRQWVCAAFI